MPKREKSEKVYGQEKRPGKGLTENYERKRMKRRRKKY